ncbi:hypothetical protein J3A83DRAFT_4211980 [Scleroderma citrinum]
MVLLHTGIILPLPSMDFFHRLTNQLKQLEHLHTALTHLPNTIPLGDEKYNFVSWAPDPEDIELYGSSEAALNHALKVTFVEQIGESP